MAAMKKPLTVALGAFFAGCASAPTAPPPPGSGEPAVRVASWEGTRVSYEDAGLGDEALVLIHGWAGSTVSWKHQFPVLAERARTLVIDLPGHGASDPPPEGYSFRAFADAVAAVMDDAGVRRGVIVGHSNGTPVALQFYRRYPERTLALVGIDGTLAKLFDAADVEALFAPFRGEGWREAMAGLLDGMPGPGLSTADRAAIREMALGTRHEAVVGGLDATLDPAAWSEDPIEVPVLLLLADQPTWDAPYEAWVRAHVPRVDLRRWHGVGHYLQMERPAEVRAALEEFLAANDLLPERAQRD